MENGATAQRTRAALLRRGRRDVDWHDGRGIGHGHPEPTLVACLRLLVNPLTVVTTLLACTLLYGQPFTLPYLALAGVSFVASFQVLAPPDLNPIGTRRGLDGTVPQTLLRWLALCAGLLLLAFAFKVSSVFSRKVVLTWLVLTPFALLAVAAGARAAVRWLMLNAYLTRRHVIVGMSEAAAALAGRLRRNPCLGTLDGCFRLHEPVRPDSVDPAPILGGIEEVLPYVRRHGIDVVHIAAPSLSEEAVAALLDELTDTTASVYFVPDLPDYDLIQARFVDIGGLPVLALRESPFCGASALMKRLSDVLLASAALLLVWPVMLIAAVGVKLSSPGPVLFRQRRHGLHGEEITVYKFRTMTVCEDGECVRQATRHDARVTPFGRFLRRTSLDELPQLINVLLGQMSIVGPRPHAVAHNETYRALIKGYMLRHKVRPGITGWAQVNGCRGETRTLERMRERLALDLEYLRNWSPWLDLKILIRTAVTLFRDRNAY